MRYTVMPKWVKWTLGTLVAMAVAIVAFVSVFEWNWLRSPLTDFASSSSGRQVKIGDISGEWSLRPRFVLSDVHLGNAEWGKQDEMFSAKRVEVIIDLPQLVRGRLVLPEIDLDTPRLILERQEDGEANWTLGAQAAVDAAKPESRDETPVIGRLAITDGTMVYRDAVAGIDIDSTISTVVGTGGEGTTQMRMEGKGSLRGEPFTLRMTGGSLLMLRESDEPYPLRIELIAGPSRSTIAGNLKDPIRFEGLNLDVTLQGDNLSRLTKLTGVPFPLTPPYDLKARLQRQGDRWLLENIRGTMGHSDLNGTLRIDTGGDRPFIDADLTSKNLDYRDVGSLIGIDPNPTRAEDPPQPTREKAKEEAAAPPPESRNEPEVVAPPPEKPATVPPQAKAGERPVAGLKPPQKPSQKPAQTPAQKLAEKPAQIPAEKPQAKAGERPSDGAQFSENGAPPPPARRVLPDAPLAVEQVRNTDARVKFRGEKVQAPNVPLSDVALDLEMKGGVLRLRPLSVGVAGGRTIADITIDARKADVQTDYDIKLDGYQFERFLAEAGLQNGGRGQIYGRIMLRGTGDTVQKSLATANGGIRLIMDRGEISNLAMELVGLDIAESAGFLAGGDKLVPIRCMAADLPVKDGELTSSFFVLDTTDTTVKVEGRANLASEQLDLRLMAQPKDPSPLSVRTPITITGAFARPQVGIEAGPLAARAAGATALGLLLTPLASLLAFIEPGRAADSDCAKLLQEANPH